MEYNPEIFQVDVRMKIQVVASNQQHAKIRIDELLKSRITQYVHPEDEPPKFRVIAVVVGHMEDEPRRLIFFENPERRQEHSEETSQEGSISPGD